MLFLITTYNLLKEDQDCQELGRDFSGQITVIHLGTILLVDDLRYKQIIRTVMKAKEQPYNAWLQAIIVVTFDIDQGQKVQVSVPERLPAAREKEISMLAFPDSNSCSQHQTLYKYIFKTSLEEFAFVCFKQKKDSTNKRGYAQKSFVVLSKLPFLIFFQKVAEFLVFKLFTLPETELQHQLRKVIEQARAWPEPQPLSKFQLQILDYKLATTTPNYLFNNGKGFLKAQNFPNSARRDKSNSLQEIVAQESLLQLGKFQQVRLAQIFSGMQQQLWSLWQSAMLNKAVLIMAETPYQASQAVLGAVSLMNPIQYGGQVHPYVTVYDSHLNRLQESQGNVLLGGTNPLFLKLFSKGAVEVVRLSQVTSKKHLKPLRELFIYSGLEQQRLVNESALRKYFYKLNCSIVAVLEEYLDLQTNDLKFFNQKDFLKFIRKELKEDPLENVFNGKKASAAFWQHFVSSLNFLLMLRARNVVRDRNA